MLNNENKENSQNENNKFASPKNILVEKKDNNQQNSMTASEDITNTQSQHSTMILCDKHLEFNQPLQDSKLACNTKMDIQNEEA